MVLDVYVLAPERSRHYFERFMVKYAPGFTEATVEYEYPRNSDVPEFITKDISVILHKVFQEPDAEYAFYFNNPSTGVVRSAMAFFTFDGGLILGLTVREQSADIFLEKLKADLDSSCGLILFEQPPPPYRSEFERLASCAPTE